MVYQTPEQKAREEIDRQLEQTGWIVQNKDEINFSAGTGIAIREYMTSSGPADYVLFINRHPVGIIEAKKEGEGQHLTEVEGQSGDYAKSKLKFYDNKELPFVFESTGIITRFTDKRDSSPRSREVFTFFKPETLKEWFNQHQSLRRRLHNLPALTDQGLRECQYKAIHGLEDAFRQSHPRALIQMATGSGKTYTAITAIYRLLKFCDAKRILFLVDTRNLGEQAEQEFMKYIPQDDNRKFTELYALQRLKSSYVPADSQVCISTIQRLYSILKGEELEEGAEDVNPNESAWQPREPMPVVYNGKVPPEFFDFIVIDECHRSIYNVWKQVLDYFDAFLIGLTATPDKRTYGFFNEVLVSEYSHEQAVADGVNVGYEVYIIETEITRNGSVLKAREYIDVRNRLTRAKRWTLLDEDIDYSGRQLDDEVVNPSQIRNIIRAFKDSLSEIFPGRDEVPKTLIFAKTDSHADDIIQITREEFGLGNEFCKKVTYKTEEDPRSILAQFRNEYNPRIAVTVDMIATGTDVRPLECLLFMRDVKSRNYFEQMKGRGTRTQSYEDLRQVTPSVNTAKTHFVIVDAIGVTRSLKTDSRPLERKKGVPLKDLLNAVMLGARDEDTFLSLASRLARLDKQMDEKDKDKFKELSSGKSINRVTTELLAPFDPDRVEEHAREMYHLTEEDPVTVSQIEEAKEKLIDRAKESFHAGLVNYIDNVRRSIEQFVDTINIDELIHKGWDKQAQEKADKVIAEFREFLEVHRDELLAISIFYNQPYRRRELTFTMIRDVMDVLRQQKPALAPSRVWEAYRQVEKVDARSPKNELIALVSLMRRVTGLDGQLTPYDDTVNRNFQRWVFRKQEGTLKFTEEQMSWLRMIKDHIANSIHLDREDLDYAPFDALGGIGRMYQLFGKEMEGIIEEMNEVLVA
ncbi:MAG: type I restriction-modification enzyme R subunit C-terminal domain-containing protein [Bacteroidales bacterium]|nr:DEAD/DEAH box helicase family protein [Lentimicrobiaceae bacterium]MDD5694118.1 type I restriction-modification enzyme R subunit C-terminal domain-containing protein [Bacteroidales bacterium]